MAIRFARTDDIAALVALGRRLHALTRFRQFDYDPRRVTAALQVALAAGNRRHVCFVAEDHHGDIAGALLAVLEQHVFSPQVVATIMHFGVLPEKRMAGYGVRLLRAFEGWSRNRQVQEISFGINSETEMEMVAALARGMGYRKVGENYVKKP